MIFGRFFFFPEFKETNFFFYKIEEKNFVVKFRK